MSSGSISRFGELAWIFRGGQSELLNGVARLSILYEDLRLEMGEFRILYEQVIALGKAGMEYRVMYFLRRALATVVEFRGGLTSVIVTQEFKAAQGGLSELDAKCIADADSYFQQNWDQIKEFRNEFAGHVKMSGVKYATEKFSNQVGHVAWNRNADGWTMGVECDFAGQILAGAIGSRLPAETDVQSELRKALDVISKGYVHAQAAMCALVHAFLWDRFGA